MKALVKTLFNSRLACILLSFVLAAVSCAGVHGYAWADNGEAVAVWDDLNTTYVSANGNAVIDLVPVGEVSREVVDITTTEEHIVWKAVITNTTGEPIPASSLRITDRKGQVFSCTLDEIGPHSSGEAVIDGSVATTNFGRATLLRTVTVSFESGFGEAPAPKAVVANDAITLPVLEGDGGRVFLGWIEKGSESNEPLSGEYVAKESVTLVAVWETIETSAPEATNPDEEVMEEPEASANETAPIIAQTGDNQDITPVLCGLIVAALFAMGVLVATRRKSSVH